MKKIVLLFLVISTVGFAQKKKKKHWSDDFVEAPKPQIPIAEIEPFKADDEAIVTYTANDFNKDKLVDAVVVMAKKDEAKIYSQTGEHPARKLIILQRNKAGKLEKITENNKIVYCYKCGTPYGNPLVSVKFKGNTLTVEHEAGKVNRWSRLTAFTYDAEKQQWFLTRDASSVYKITGGHIKSIQLFPKDFGVITFEQYDYTAENLRKQQ